MPHNVRDIQHRRLALLLDAHQQKIHQVRLHHIHVPNVREKSVAEDTAHEVQKGNELCASGPLECIPGPGVLDKLGLVSGRSFLVGPETNWVFFPLTSNAQAIHEILPINPEPSPTGDP